MTTKKELEKLIDAEERIIDEAQKRRADLKLQLRRLETGFVEGDIIEWQHYGEKLRGKIFDLSDSLFPRAYLFKKDGTLGSAWRHVYDRNAKKVPA